MASCKIQAFVVDGCSVAGVSPRCGFRQARPATGARRGKSPLYVRAKVATTAASDSGRGKGQEARSPISFLMPWLGSVPRVRVRLSSDRPMQQLAELAVLNERLDGKRPWEARQKLDYFQKSKATWKAICQSIVDEDAIATLEKIEEAQRKVYSYPFTC